MLRANLVPGASPAIILFASGCAMSPLTKESDVLAAPPRPSAVQPAAPAARPEDAAGKPQPVALEVTVTVNGARTVPGSDKREPFSETTKTVLVFNTGAVIRLSSQVEPGQLLFLTNEKTKKEVVCQVVKSKNYRSVSGYVELEFTEPAVGFWGMRFPGDRLGPSAAAPVASKPAPASVPRPETPVSPAPAAPFSSAPVAPNPPALSPAASSAVVPSSAPSSPVLPGKVETPAPEIVVSSPAPEIKPVTLPVANVVTKAAVDPNSTEALKLEAARLQEQLSALLFAPPPPAKPKALEPVVDPKAISETAAKVLEFVRPAPVAAPPVTPAPAAIPETPIAKAPSIPSKFSLEDEELKVPSWLEPLARNVSISTPPVAAVAPAAPVAPPAPAAPLNDSQAASEEMAVPYWLEPLARNASAAPASAPAVAQPVMGEELPVLEQLADSVDPVSSHSNMVEVPAFGSRLLDGDSDVFSGSTSSSGSKRGVLITAIAAGVLLAVAAGTWYFRQPDPSAPARVAAASVPAPAPGARSESAAVPPPNTPNDSSVTASAVAAPAASSASSAQQELQPVSQPLRVPRDSGKTPAPNLAVSASRVSEPVGVPQRKPVLGEIKLAAPKVSRGGSSQGLTEAAPNVLAGQESAASSGEALSAGLSGGQPSGPAAPAAPVPIGGDVKTAQLISSVRPVYPSLARSQHASGDVKIDALIDATGRVTTMKVISGPTLLHQAAMDALRQWKYKPAALNGTPTSTHLTVTIQFRLQ